MIYKKFKDLELSALGMGCMRLPIKEGNETSIDEAEAARMLDYALSRGVNYIDTAWGYHGGQSELVMGRLLAKYPRDSYYLADKFPGYDVSNLGKVVEIFEKQLEKTGMDYFDFYLVHNVCELNIDGYLDPANGILDYLLKQKENGRIRHLGFSVHGTFDTMMRFMEVYGDYMEFCQVQLNWIDWEFQDAKAKVEYLNERNIPVWVMEPLCGGSLVKLSDENAARLKELRPDESLAGWAFRFLETVPGVTVVLSGASNFDQMAENIRTFETSAPLNENEWETLLDMARRMTGGVPCTSCRYCTSHCPQQIDIPFMISLYNEHTYSGGGFIAPMALASISADRRPSAYVGCQSCEAVCPQQIRISEVMADFADKLKM